MDIKKMPKDELELLSNKDITFYLLEQSNKSINTKDLFTEIIELLELPKKTFDEKIGDYYTSLTTDKRFILLDNAEWDLKDKHKVEIVLDDDIDEDEEELFDSEDEESLDAEEDNSDSLEITDDEVDLDDDMEDLTIVDDEEIDDEA